MIEASQFGDGQVLVSMLWFFLFFIWIWLLITVFGDIFRSDDLGGWSKALWTFFVIIVPYFGVFLYLIIRGHKMNARAVAAAQAQDAAAKEYIRNVAGSDAGGASSELSRLADLHDRGVLNDAEFEQAKAKALAG